MTNFAKCWLLCEKSLSSGQRYRRCYAYITYMTSWSINNVGLCFGYYRFEILRTLWLRSHGTGRIQDCMCLSPSGSGVHTVKMDENLTGSIRVHTSKLDEFEHGPEFVRSRVNVAYVFVSTKSQIHRFLAVFYEGWKNRYPPNLAQPFAGDSLDRIMIII